MTSGPPPICEWCVHKHRENEMGYTCDAFPDGVPHVIIMNGVDHRQPYQGDQGIRFEAVMPEGDAYAEDMFSR